MAAEPHRQILIYQERTHSSFLLIAFAACATAGPLVSQGAEKAPPAVATRPAVTSAPTDADWSLPVSDDGVQDLQLLELEVPTVITGTRHRQTVATAPYAVSVITAQDIRAAGARSVPDALRLVPGMDVAELGYNVAAVSPRGMERYLSSQVLVLVDGRQLYNSMFGGTDWGAWPFQLEDIARIEVIRGSGGVTWGTNAVNGVINIVTKDPAEQLGLTTVTSGGSRGTAKEHTGYAFQDGKLRMRVSGEYERSDGFQRGGSLLFPLDDEVKIGRMGVHAIYDAGPRDKLTISGGSGISQGGLWPSPLNRRGTERVPSMQTNFVLGKWTHDVALDNTVNVTGYVNDSYYTQGSDMVEFRYEQFALQLGHTLKPVENHTITWGIDTRADYVIGALADPYIMTENYASSGLIGAYIEDSWQFAPKWTLHLGGRIDYDFYGGFQPGGRAAISYEPQRDSLIYAAVSRAFMLPSVGDRFQDEPVMLGLGHLTSHVGMTPTTAITYELGARRKFFDKLDANLDIYWNEYNDWPTQQIKPGPPGLFRLDYDTRASASAYGVELGTRYAVTSRLTLLGNYTCEQLDWRGAMNPTMEGDINTPPKHKFMLGARWDPMEDLHLSSHLYYVDTVWAPNSSMPFLPRHIPHYFRLDLRAEYEFWKKQAAVAVGVRNLLDSHHREGGTLFLHTGEVPRMIYGEIRFQLGK